MNGATAPSSKCSKRWCSDRDMIPGLFVLIGAFALAAQTILLREYLVLHGGNELAVGLFYGSWFFWIAVTASAVALRRREAKRRWGLERYFSPLLAAYPVALLAQILLIRATRSLAGVPPTEPFALGALALWTTLTNAPVSIVTGAIFPAGCAAVSRSEPRGAPSNAVARAYILESAGSFVGGVLVTAVLGSWLPAFHVGLGAACAVALGGSVYAVRRGLKRQLWLHASLAGALVVALAGPWGTQLASSSVRDRFAAIVPRAELVASVDTPYQHASVARLGQQVLLLSNGRIVAALPDDEQHAMRAALLLSQPATLRKVLLIGSGAQGLVRHLLEYPVERLLYVEPDERAFRLAEPHLPSTDRAALADPRLELAFTDGRFLVNELSRHDNERFDLALVLVPDPDTAALNRYFTVEFYRALAAVLAPEGVVATRINSGENVLGTELANYGASVFHTLGQVFRDVVATPGEESWLLAADRPGRVTVDAAELAERYRSLAPSTGRFPAEGFISLLEPERVRFVEEVYRRRALDDPDGLVNTDARPVTYFLNLLVLGRHTSSAAVAVLRAAREAGVWLFALPLLVLLALRLHYVVRTPAPPNRHRFHATLVLVAFGLASIALQIVLIFAFQNRFGLVFEQIGLVGALFMVGLAAGAAGASRVGRQPSPAPRGATGDTVATQPALRRTMVVTGLTALLALAVPWLVGGLGQAPPTAARIGYYVLFLATGSLSGAAFPLAGRLAEGAERSAGTIGALLESADHWGAALGAAVVGAVMVPVVGTGGSCLVVAAALGACGVALGLDSPAVTARLRRLRGPLDRPGRHSFPWHRLSYALVALTLIATSTATLLRQATDRPSVRIGPHRLSATVPAQRFEETARPFLHYRAFAEDEEQFHNVTFASLAVTDEIQGYAGPLNLLVSIDADGTIRRVELISSDETPAYIVDLGRFLQWFEGKQATKRFALADPDGGNSDYEIDGMTGATVTSRAAIETVNAATLAAGTQILDLDVERGVRSGAPSPWSSDVLYIIVAFVLAIPVSLRAPAWLRTAYLATNLLLAGLVYNVQLSLTHVAEVSLGLLPTPANLLLFVLLLGAVLLAVAFGPAYCSLLCPFGAAQELVFGADRAARRLRRDCVGSNDASGARAGPKSWPGRWARPAVAVALAVALTDWASPALLPNIANRWVRDAFLLGALALGFAILRRSMMALAGAVSPAVHARGRYVKYVLLAVVLTTYAVTGSDAVLSFDPLAVAFSGSYSDLTFLLLAVLLLLCLYYFRFWCRWFCPVGALLNLSNKLALVGRRYRPKKYRRCDLGVQSVHDVDCIQCNRCVTGAIGPGSGCLSTSLTAAQEQAADGRPGDGARSPQETDRC